MEPEWLTIARKRIFDEAAEALENLFITAGSLDIERDWAFATFIKALRKHYEKEEGGTNDESSQM